MSAEIRYSNKDIRFFSEPKRVKIIASTGPDFYDYRCELLAVWKAWHESDIKKESFAA